MDGSILVPLSLVSLVVAMILTLYDMRSSLRPAACPECAHCRALAEDEARTQERLSREYARKIGLRDEDDDRRIG
jgi:uncharacterized membrane protein